MECDPSKIRQKIRRYTTYLISGLSDFLPAYPGAVPTIGDDNQVDWSAVTWKGQRPDMSRALTAMGKMHELDNTPALVKQSVMLILDGSGTVVNKPQDAAKSAKAWCFWKKENQLRWYVAVDAAGFIYFVSPVYWGKVDDTCALIHTGFYEYVPIIWCPFA
jgi:hypothetical protein